MAFYHKVSKQEGFRVAETPDIIYGKKNLAAIKAVQKAVIAAEILRNKLPEVKTGRIIYKNGIATEETIKKGEVILKPKKRKNRRKNKNKK